MSRRLTLAQLDHLVFELLDEDWRAVTDFTDHLGLGSGLNHYRVALVLERLANDGYAEIKRKPGSRRRKYRRPRRGEL